jgi:hypothetical protein
MNKNEDGSVTLTRDDLASLSSAYYALFDALDGIPGFLDQWSMESDGDYINVANWREILADREPFEKSTQP